MSIRRRGLANLSVEVCLASAVLDAAPAPAVKAVAEAPTARNCGPWRCSTMSGG